MGIFGVSPPKRGLSQRRRGHRGGEGQEEERNYETRERRERGARRRDGSHRGTEDAEGKRGCPSSSSLALLAPWREKDRRWLSQRHRGHRGEEGSSRVALPWRSLRLGERRTGFSPSHAADGLRCAPARVGVTAARARLTFRLKRDSSSHQSSIPL